MSNLVSAAKDRLDIVAVGIEHERRVVFEHRRFQRPLLDPVSRRPVVCPTGCKGSGVEGLDLGAASGDESRVLPDGMGVVAVDPEDRVFDAVAYPIGAPPGGSCMARWRPSAPSAAS
jgi:hypothetical protein